MKRVLGVALVLVSALFLVRMASRDWATVQASTWRFEPRWVSAALVTQVAVLALGMFGWAQVLRLTDAVSPGLLVLWRLWSLASLARFVPGAVWQFVAADRLAANQGLARRVWSQSLAVHLGFSLAGAGVVAVLALPRWAWWLGALALACVHPRVVRLMLQVFAKVTRQEPLRWHAGFRHGVALLLLAAAGWALSGLGLTMLLHALGRDEVPRLVTLGANAGSWLAGVVVVFAPSGLGVRELVTAWSLAPWVGEGDAVLLSAAARLWSLAAELLAAALASVLVSARRSASGS